MTPNEVDLAIATDSERWANEFVALERLLTLCQFDDGTLDERLRALPLRAFGRAVLHLYALGWATPSKEH